MVGVMRERTENAAPSEAGEQKQWPSTGPGHKKAHAKPGTIEGNLARNTASEDAPFNDDLPF